MSNPNLGGFGRNTWNSGEWNTLFTVTVTGVSSAAAVGSVQIDITVPLTGVESASILGRVNIWEEINPGQDADWDPITYTQTPSWAKIAA
tara:strand:+ start:2151 stop:2420 length:270 start_codon:yes stop_codon:yes gene_type:complete